MIAPLRVGLVGFGAGGKYFHAPLLHAASEIDLVGVVTSDPGRQAAVATALPGVPVVPTLADLLEVGAEAVAISTPAATHSALTDEALDAGLHVVCDKPFSLDAASALRSVELAERLGRRLSPYQNRRWDADFLTVQSLVADGTLGTVRRFESRFERDAPGRGPGAAGGGVLLDFHSHLVDQALVLLGPAVRVYAESTIRDTGRDDDVFVAITHVGGARSHLWGSWSQPTGRTRFRVTGTMGGYLVDGPMEGQEAALIAGQSPATLGEAWGVEPEDRWGSLFRDGAVERVPSVRGAWDGFYPSFARAVRGLGPLPVNPRDAVETARVLDAARASAVSGKVVHIEPRIAAKAEP